MYKFLALTFIFIQGCAVLETPNLGYNDPYLLHDATKRKHETSIITWIVADNAKQECSRLAKKFNLVELTGNVLGCAFFGEAEDNNCIIVTNKKVAIHTLGHEFLHCFKGHWH